MCGRFARARNAHELQLAFDFAEVPDPSAPADPRSRPPLEELEPDYNICPGKPVHAVLGTPPNEAAQGVPPGPRSLATFRWGLIPSWAKDANVGFKMINARGETAAEKPAFRAALAHRRCLLPADAYYEWQLLPDAAPGTAEPGTSPATDPGHKRRKASAKKKPFSVAYPGGEPLALAGLFERWRDPEAPEGDPAAWVWSCTVVTTQATGVLEDIHERMPVVVPRREWAAWLDPASGLADVQRVMASTPVDAFAVREVSTAVNSIKNNGPGLLEPPAPTAAGGDDTLF